MDRDPFDFEPNPPAVNDEVERPQGGEDDPALMGPVLEVHGVEGSDRGFDVRCLFGRRALAVALNHRDVAELVRLAFDLVHHVDEERKRHVRHGGQDRQLFAGGKSGLGGGKRQAGRAGEQRESGEMSQLHQVLPYARHARLMPLLCERLTPSARSAGGLLSDPAEERVK